MPHTAWVLGRRRLRGKGKRIEEEAEEKAKGGMQRETVNRLGAKGKCEVKIMVEKHHSKVFTLPV